MKVTDYAPRAAPFDSYLAAIGHNLIGIEIGVDVGAHAQALLQYCPIRMLTLVDPWPNPYCRGYCEGRLSALGFRARFGMLQCGSIEAAAKVGVEQLDFAYIDQEHGGDSVAADLRAWWPKIKPGGVLGYRNYSDTKTPLVAAVDAFVAAERGIVATKATGEIVMVKSC